MRPFLPPLKDLIKSLHPNGRKIISEINTTKLLVSNLLAKQNLSNKESILEDINLAEFKVFSQWGDDGIIQFLADYLDLTNRTFVEFGVETYQESNTRHLLLANNWSGLIMDGSAKNIKKATPESLLWRYQLKGKTAFITKSNVLELISDSGFARDLDLLHIDIDGNDYWIWLELAHLRPSVIIFEYNSTFGIENPITVPYKEDFSRFREHYSGLYFGASLKAFYDSATDLDYSFIGCNSNGNNAYFVRNDKLKDLKPRTLESGFIDSKFRESRDTEGNLSYLEGDNRIKELAGLPVFNCQTNTIENL